MSIQNKLRRAGFLVMGSLMMVSFQNCSQPGEIEFASVSGKLTTVEPTASVEVEVPALEIDADVEAEIEAHVPASEVAVEVEADVEIPEAADAEASVEVDAEVDADLEVIESPEAKNYCPQIADVNLKVESFTVACLKGGKIGICTANVVKTNISANSAFVIIKSDEDIILPKLPELKLIMSGAVGLDFKNKQVELQMTDKSILGFRLPGLKQKMEAGVEYKIKIDLKHEMALSDGKCKMKSVAKRGNCEKNKKDKKRKKDHHEEVDHDEEHDKNHHDNKKSEER